MHTPVFQNGSASLTDHAIDTVSTVSRRLAGGDGRISPHEFNAAAIVNGRLDLIGRDYRIELVAVGRDWAHAVIDQIFTDWDKKMTLPAEHGVAPIGDQRMFPGPSA